MTPEEFAAFVDAQLLGVDEAEASARHDELGGTDPHFTAGVKAAEVGNPIALDVNLPGLSESEAADAEARAAQLDALEKGDRQAINDEADRRYWRKRGLPAQTKIVEAADQELWKRTRDEVVRDRNRLDALPAEVRALVMPGDKRPSPGDYGDALRLGHKLEAFTWEDWALFQRRRGTAARGLAATEKAVDAFNQDRAKERKTIERVQGTEGVYDLVLRFNVARSMGMKPEQYKRFPDYERMHARLAEAGFSSVADYENATSRYMLLFQSRAFEIAMLALQGSEHVVRSELARYGDKRVLDVMFADLARLRGLIDDYLEKTGGAGEGSRAPIPTLDQADAERTRLTAKYPSLADTKLDTTDLNAKTPEALGILLRDNARDRLDNIGDTRQRITDKPRRALHMDRVLNLTRQELGAADGTVGWRIVKQSLDDEANRERWKQEVLLLVAIGVGLLTFGEGTPVVLGLGGGVALGGYQAYDEWEKYQAAMAAAHTSLDPTQSLSSTDPSLVWFAFALIGMGLDAAFLGKALLAAKPAIAALEATGDVAKFSSALAKAPELTPGLRTALTRVGEAKEDFKAVWAAFWKTSGRALSGGDPTVIVTVGQLAYHAARIGVRKFEVFLEALKAERRILGNVGLDIEKLSGDELKQWKQAFNRGVREFDATRTTVKVQFKKGTKTITFADEMLIDGKPVGTRVRDDVMKELDLAHTDRGHGAFRDERTLANEALQNAAKPQGAGMSGQWASDEKMFESLARAKARAASGFATRAPNSKWIVDLEASPDVGKIFAANSHLPPGAVVRRAVPVAGLPVTEIAPNKVRALFDRVNGEYTLSSIFPIFEP
jgi:hypothetical protein